MCLFLNVNAFFALLLQLFSFVVQMKWFIIALIWQILLSGVIAVGMLHSSSLALWCLAYSLTVA